MYLKEILSIAVGLARGVELTLITKKKKKVTDIYGVNEYRHLFIPLLSTRFWYSIWLASRPRNYI